MVEYIAWLLSMLLVPFAGFMLYQWNKAPGKFQGPRPWPLLGNVWTIYKLHANPDAMCEQLGKYGDVCVLRLGSQPILVINSAKAAHELLHTRSAITASRPENYKFRTTLGRGRMVLTPAGSEFRSLRKIYHSILGPQQSSASRSIQDLESVVFLGNLLDEPDDAYYGAERFALSLIFSLVYGIRIASLKHPVIVKLYYIWENLLSRMQPGTVLLPDLFPCLLNLPTWMQPWYVWASNLVNQELAIHILFLSRVKQRGAMLQCFGTTLLKWQEAENVDNGLVLGILAMLTGAGSDTTSSVLQYFFKAMVLHPEAAAAAQEELDQVIGRNRLPGWDDEMSLPYVRALIKEVHRWAPIGSLGIPHASTEDDTYKDLEIPKGTILFPNLVTLKTDQDRYLDPDAFKPKRFLGDALDASASALQADYLERDHVHYGFGRRLCQGIFVAEASLFIAISRILWAFRFQELPECPIKMSDKIYGAATKPKPYRISIVCRDEASAAVIRAEIRRQKSPFQALEDLEL